MDQNLERWGIHPGYHDMFGNWHATSAETKTALLAAMGVDSEQLPSSARLDVQVLGRVIASELASEAELILEDGTTFAVDWPVTARSADRIPSIAVRWQCSRALIIRRPATCHFDPAMQIWGLAVQLYAARSSQSWGMGDLGI
jgi:hypothetical protein